MYAAPPLVTEEPVMLININRLFERGLSHEELYDATRKSWVVGERRYKAKYAIATFRGITREIYRIRNWYQMENRWAFDGEVADEEIRGALRYKMITGFNKRGAANPIRYLNC